ncbi:MAG: hypothetical protein M3Y81_27175, partial [Chloroflexota bacterium]|nr:hypothetical protein [Chloroflexota bacterium]
VNRVRLSVPFTKEKPMMFKKISISLAALGAVSFGVYLRFIRPWQLRWGATDEELERRMSGDEVVKHPTSNATRAVTIQARPEEIWPWLVQIGQGKAGYYSYERMENLFGLKMKNAEGINPAWQSLQVGDIIPAEPSGKGFKVYAREPERALVLGGREGEAGVFEGFTQMFPTLSWAFVLVPLDSEHTRLISRLRGQNRPSFWNRVTGIFFEPIEFLMTSRMLLGIKQQAEHPSRQTAEPIGTPGRSMPGSSEFVAQEMEGA